MPDKRLLGAHLSISGGIDKSIDRGLVIGATAIQIFTSFPSRWAKRLISEEELIKFQIKRALMKKVFAHANYLINLATSSSIILEKSYFSMLEELKRAEKLSLPYVVITIPGSHLGKGEKEGLRAIAGQLNRLISETAGFQVKILLETTAGQGTNSGYRFEHFAEIFSLIKNEERIGVCFDTCHSFAAGYDFQDLSNDRKNLAVLYSLIDS